MTGPRVTWLADKSGLAHAHVGRGRVIRTACRQPAIDPRGAWPATSRCETCTAAVEQLTEAATQAARK